jgi:hypothetical protein
MNALSHTTSRVLLNRRSNQYTPGLHGHPSTILIGARDSEPTTGGRASTFALHFLSWSVPGQGSPRLCPRDCWAVLYQGVTFCTPSNRLFVCDGLLGLPLVQSQQLVALDYCACLSGRRYCTQKLIKHLKLADKYYFI